MLHSSTLEKLAKILLGDDVEFPTYRTANELKSFFETVGVGDVHWDSESRSKNTIRVLKHCAKTCPDKLHYIVNEALHLVHFRDDNTKDIDARNLADEQLQSAAVAFLLPYLEKDGWSLTKNNNQSYDLARSSEISVSISSLDKLSHQNIKSSLDKVHKKLAEGDFDGAISSARTLVEEIQVALIKQSGNKLENYNGDMNKLFQQTKKTFNLDPSKKDVTETLKQILSGLNSVVVGIAGISNMLGDRHATVYRPSEHHAKLAVNAALTFCEFLVDSYEYQKTRRQP